MFLGKFIRDQRLCRLRYPTENTAPVFDYIDALGTNPLPNVDESRQQFDSSDPELWPEEPNRHEFLRDLSIRRLCVTVEGGVGKSKLLEELEVATEAGKPGHIVLRLDLRDLPEDADQFVHREIEVKEPDKTTNHPPLLIHRLRQQFGMIRNRSPRSTWRFPTDPEIDFLLLHALRTGDLTLIVDAFDQLNRQAAQSRVSALRYFIRDYFPSIRLVVAGRPYAIKRIWDELDLGELMRVLVDGPHGSAREIPRWTFCKVERFSGTQAEKYLTADGKGDGKNKLQALKRMNASELRLPRTLNIIRNLKSGELAQMQTASDLYWFAMNETVIENFRNASNDFELKYLKRKHVIPIASAVAFAMMTWRDDPVDCVPSLVTDCASDFFGYMQRAGFVDVLRLHKIDFQNELLDLAGIDSESIQFHFYSETTDTQRPDEVVDVRMSDVTIRDFFAAHWASRYWGEHRQWLRSNDVEGVDPRPRIERSVEFI